MGILGREGPTTHRPGFAGCARDQGVMTSLGHGGHIVMISDSVSLNQTGVHIDTCFFLFFFFLTAGKCFLVEYRGALTVPDRYLHFLKLFLAPFTSFGLEAGRFTNGCFPIFCPADHLNHPIFEYKQIPHVGCPAIFKYSDTRHCRVKMLMDFYVANEADIGVMVTQAQNWVTV